MTARVAALLAAGIQLAGCSRKSEPPREQPTASREDGGLPAPDDRFSSDVLGALTFPLTEGNAAARVHFARGMLALHSFWYDEAARQFTAAAAADPTMNLPHWGVAMSHLHLLWGEDDLDAAKQALARMPDPERLSEREQAWVFATVDLMRAPDVRAGRAAYVWALEGLHARHPDDETATFLAVALLSTIRPEDPGNLVIRERAAALAGGVFERNPKHPGGAHYLIHAYDTPALAPRALAAARAYPTVAPAAFHAQHMPSHIFSRLGMWSEAITSCRAAWEASLAAAKREKLSANAHDFHSLSWLVEMPFELGKRAQADAALAEFAAAVRGGLARKHRELYAIEVGSYVMRTGEAARIDELLAPLDAAPVEDGPRPTRAAGSSHCAPGAAPDALGEQAAVLEARALAAALQRDLVGTRRLVAELDLVRDKLAKQQPALAAAHARKREVLLARAAGDDRALVTALKKAAEAAHVETGGENNPTAFVAYEELAEAHARLGQHAAAADAYARALAQHPRRARSLLGAARVAKARGDVQAARAFYTQLLEVWRDAEPATPGLAEARAAVTE